MSLTLGVVGRRYRRRRSKLSKTVCCWKKVTVVAQKIIVNQLPWLYLFPILEIIMEELFAVKVAIF